MYSASAYPFSLMPIITCSEEVAKFPCRPAYVGQDHEDMGPPMKGNDAAFSYSNGRKHTDSQQPMNNISRVTVQTLAAVMGGTQSLHTNGYDEALSLPTEEAARIALRTQQIVAFESGAADTADPLAGSYYVESLTDAVEQEAWKLIQTIDAMGGSVAAIEKGLYRMRLPAAPMNIKKNIENGNKVIVGVNKFTSESQDHIPVFRIDDSIRKCSRTNWPLYGPGATIKLCLKDWPR